MTEKRFTLRFNEEIFNIAQKTALLNHRSTAKEIEFALSRYYFLKPIIDTLFDDIIRNNPNMDETTIKDILIKEMAFIVESYVKNRYPSDK